MILKKKQQRGPTVTLSLTVIAKLGVEVLSDDMNVNDFALIRFRFRLVIKRQNTCMLVPTMMFKKHEKAKYSTVKIHLSTKEFEKQCICSDDEDKVKINPIKCNYFISESFASVTSFDVILTVRDITSSSPINKMYVDTEFTDFQLCAADGSVAVHKVLLSGYSDMFKTMLRGEWKETTEGRINIDGVNVQTLQHLKGYMYLGTLPDDGLEPLLLLAVHYFMDSLKADCITKLVERVRPDDANDLIKFACENNLPDLVKAMLLETPDAIINGISNLEISKKEI